MRSVMEGPLADMVKAATGGRRCSGAAVGGERRQAAGASRVPARAGAPARCRVQGSITIAERPPQQKQLRAEGEAPEHSAYGGRQPRWALPREPQPLPARDEGAATHLNAEQATARVGASAEEPGLPW